LVAVINHAVHINDESGFAANLIESMHVTAE
jgi:hypothetical protein